MKPIVSFAIAIVCTLYASLSLGATPQPSETLARIKEKKTIVIGVKSDYRPFGFLDANGASVGIELDLANDIATRLGVKLVTMSVSSANRLQRLEEGMIDVVLATTGDTVDRRRIATMIEPNYYASGSTLLVKKSKRVHDWNEMRGKQICSVQGNYSNRQMAQRYLLELVLFNNARDAKLALQDGRCDAFLADNTAIQGDLARPEWSAYEAPLSPAMSVPWAIVVARSEQGTELEKLLGDTVADWHRSGFLLQKEKAWGLPASKFLQDAHLLWKRQLDGKPFCARQADGQWTAACRNQVLLTAKDVSGLQAIGLWFRELTSLDITIAYDEYDRTRFLKSILQSILLIIACLIGSVILAIVGTFAELSPSKLLNKCVFGLAIYGRSTPPLLQMYMLFFGAGALLQEQFGFALPPFAIVVWCLSYYTGSSMMAALVSSAEHKLEEDPSFRISLSNLREIFSLSSGSVSSTLVNCARATMAASAIAIPEILSVTTSIMTDNGNPIVMMNALLIVVFVIMAMTYKAIQYIDKRYIHQPGQAV